jgi:hypothetical protein
VPTIFESFTPLGIAAFFTSSVAVGFFAVPESEWSALRAAESIPMAAHWHYKP